MKRISIVKILSLLLLLSLPFNVTHTFGQSVVKSMFRLPDTGQFTSFTATFGEDNDYTINPPAFMVNGDGTVTDTVTGLQWQQTDGGEMTVENAALYCDSLTLGGYTDWRLPTPHEAFSILNHQANNPALDTKVFTKTAAEYWWTNAKQVNDATKIWVTNAGGGIGNHPKAETVSAGGTKKIHARAVRDVKAPLTVPNHFTDNGDGTITDNLTNRQWQKITPQNAMTWEESLMYAEGLTLAGASDWRLPNIKELQSMSDESQMSPSVQTSYFTTIGVKKYWSSTSNRNLTSSAWYLNTQFGITSYDQKTVGNYVICVRSSDTPSTSVQEDSQYDTKVEISPNPAGSDVRLTIPQEFPDVGFVEIRNLLGELLYSTKIDRNHRTIPINTENFDNGLYVVSLIGRSLRHTSTLIIYK